MHIKNRISRLYNNIDEKLDAILIKNANEPFLDTNFFYVTGLSKGLFEGSVALVYSKGDIDIIVPELEAQSAAKSPANILVYKNNEECDQILKKSVKGLKKIGVNFSGLSYQNYIKLHELLPKIKFIDISMALSKTRAIKDNDEIGKIKKACSIADKVMESIKESLSKNMYEYEIAAEINYLLQKFGADRPAFDTISSFGKNTAEPHYTHGNTKLGRGDFVLFDFGARFEKYNSDTTRTIVYGVASKEQKLMHDIVKSAQQVGFDSLSSGIKGSEVHEKVQNYIDATKFKGRFIHSTGHSLGLDVHDGWIGFSRDCDIELQENMILTVEPGIYVPGYGGVRIEDDVLIRKDGAEILTHSSRQLIEA
jgi:Xaa-Pro dipeptidase